MVEKLAKKKKSLFEFKGDIRIFFLFHMKFDENHYRGFDIKFMKILKLC